MVNKLLEKYVGHVILLSIIILLLIFDKIRGKLYAVGIICICLIYISLYHTFIHLEPNEECISKKGDKKHQGILGGGCIDIWHLKHLLFWIIIGILIPGHLLVIILLSVIWECAEHVYFKYLTPKTKCDFFFCGRFEDIVVNIIGYLIGWWISTLR